MTADSGSRRRPKVLLGVTGGIAAYKSVELVRRLQERGLEVRCAVSRGAEAFVTPLTLEVLTGHAVYCQEYLSATGRGEESHIVAAEWADVVCIAPATAHMLSRMSLGLADDFLTTTLLAFPGPVLVAPAMHSEMWNKPAVRRNVESLRAEGTFFVGPIEGLLASGEWGMGRIGLAVGYCRRGGLSRRAGGSLGSEGAGFRGADPRAH